MAKPFKTSHRRKAAAHKLKKQDNVPSDQDLDAIGAGLPDEELVALMGELGIDPDDQADADDSVQIASDD